MNEVKQLPESLRQLIQVGGYLTGFSLGLAIRAGAAAFEKIKQKERA